MSTGGDTKVCFTWSALAVMQQLVLFEPRSIGSVSSGRIRRGSHIDLHVFSDDPDAPGAALRELGWAYEKEVAQIRRGDAWLDYLHLHVDAELPVALTVSVICDPCTTQAAPDVPARAATR